MSEEKIEPASEEGIEKDSIIDDKENSQEESSEKEENTKLKDKITDLEKELSALKDQYLRKQADFENFRKRMFKEKDDAIKYANSNLLIDLVSIIDDFERAIKSAEESQDFSTFLTGVTLIEKQFVGMLERNWGLKRMECQGMDFDPEMHEALMAVEGEEYDRQIVLEDFQKGYTLNDRIIRHAKVKVGVPAAEKCGQKETEKLNSKLDNEEEIQ